MSIRTIHQDQSGIVAFVVTLLVMLVITITTLGLAQIARREQRQAVDKLLGVEATYAAESGINDALDVLQTSPNQAYNSCSQAPSINTHWDQDGNALGNELSVGSSSIGSAILGDYSSGDVSYSCALVTQNPTSLEYSSVSTDRSINSYIDTSADGPTNKLVIGWQADNGNASFRSCPSTPTFPVGGSIVAGAWNADTPLLKIDVTNLNSGGYSRAALATNTYSFYAYPCNGGSNPGATSIPFNPGVQTEGDIKNVSCDQAANHSYDTVTNLRPLRCNLNVGFGGTGPTNILVRVKPYYANARVSILSLNGSTPRHMQKAQTVIDVTGKAADELKRTQVRVSGTSPYLYGAESNGPICKLLVTNSSTTVYDPSGVAGNDSSVCDPSQL